MQIITGQDTTNSRDTKARKRQKTSYFSKPELTRILNVYSHRVAAGEWRDYALITLTGWLIFRSIGQAMKCLFTPLKRKD